MRCRQRRHTRGPSATARLKPAARHSTHRATTRPSVTRRRAASVPASRLPPFPRRRAGVVAAVHSHRDRVPSAAATHAGGARHP